MGQVLPWNSLTVPYTRARDPDGVRGPPCETPQELPRSWVILLREDLKATGALLDSPSLPPTEMHSVFVSFLPSPLEGWRPGAAPVLVYMTENREKRGEWQIVISPEFS